MNSFIQVKVFTDRGRTNATLIMTACQSDGAHSCAHVRLAKGFLQRACPVCGCRQLISALLILKLKTLCPNLQLRALDPVHLAMTCKYASLRRQTGFTKVVRRMPAVDSTLDAGAWRKFFDGGTSPPLPAAEINFRIQIEDGSMRQTGAVMQSCLCTGRQTSPRP